MPMFSLELAGLASAAMTWAVRESPACRAIAFPHSNALQALKGLQSEVRPHADAADSEGVQ